MATNLNGEPITADHGYPLRGEWVLSPDVKDWTTSYFWKGAKWAVFVGIMP